MASPIWLVADPNVQDQGLIACVTSPDSGN